MKANTKVIMTAIIAIAALEAIALYKGIDGMMLTVVIGAMAGMAGYVIPSPKLK